MYRLRIAFFLLFLFLYFGGYPALQFAPRHYFHLEVMTLWAVGFVISHAFRRRPPLHPSQVGVFVLVSAAIVLIPLSVLRLYQQQQARRVLADMINAPKTTIPLAFDDISHLISVNGPTAFADVRLMEVDVNRSACRSAPAITFRYAADEPDYDFSRVVRVPPETDGRRTTKVFEPVFSSVFKGLELSPGAVGCVVGAYWVETNHRPLALAAVLSPGWESQKLYQRLWFEAGVKSVQAHHNEFDARGH